MPKNDNFLTAKQYSKRSGLTTASVISYGSTGKIKRRKLNGKFKYYWEDSPANPDKEYICEDCGESEEKCRKMMVVKMIEEFLVDMDKFIGCGCDDG